jgi:hypothetical protein
VDLQVAPKSDSAFSEYDRIRAPELREALKFIGTPPRVDIACECFSKAVVFLFELRVLFVYASGVATQSLAPISSSF